MINLLDSVSKLKEGLLALIAIDYGIGLISWNIYSWTESLGVNSAFELQYFIAGLPPLLIGGFLYWYWKMGRTVVSGFRKKIKRKAIGYYRLTRILVVTITYGSILSAIIILILTLLGVLEDDGTISSLQIALIIAASLCGTFLPDDGLSIFLKDRKIEMKRRIRFFASLNSLYSRLFAVYSICLTTFLIPLYYLFVYTNIPQELGGVKPKYCVFTSSHKEFFRNERMRPLYGKATINDAFVSRNVMVYFYNDRKLILKINKSDKSIYEIDRNDTDMIIWKN